MKKLQIKIYGRVQGVGFRYAAEKKARGFGVAVSARNEPDGSVVIDAEGDEAALETFVEWCRKGPRSAKVERLIVI